MELESSSLALGTEVLEIAKELAGKDADTVAFFLNRKLAELELRRKSEEAKYIGPNLSGWGILPDLILEKIFSYLTIQARYYASCTCKQWYYAFHSLRTWQNFLMADTTLTRRRYDYGMRSWRHILDHYRTQQYIRHVGHYIRHLTLTPKSFFGLFAHHHFMNHISSYAERYEDDPESPLSCLFKIKSLRFVFYCNIANRGAERCVIGTGGDILLSIKRLIGNLKYLTRLDLIDLLLVPEDAIHLLDKACASLCDQLRILTLVNATKDHFTLLHPACFVNLRILYISPQSLGDEMVDMLANLRNFEQLHIVQNCYSGFAQPVDPKCWYRVNHLFRIYLRTTSPSVIEKEMVWQERANVVSILYDCPFTKFSTTAVVTIIDLYSDSIRTFGYLGLPKFRSSRKFLARIDASLLTLCRKCPYLTTLFVRDRISTATALLIAGMSPNLRYFYVRRNALIKKCDFMFHYNLYLDYNFSQWIRLNAKSYERTTREIATILGNSKNSNSWKPLSDKEFKAICAHYPAY